MWNGNRFRTIIVCHEDCMRFLKFFSLAVRFAPKTYITSYMNDKTKKKKKKKKGLFDRKCHLVDPTSVYKTNQASLSLFFIHPLTQFSYFCLATYLFFKPFSSSIPLNFIFSLNPNPQKKINFFWWKKFQRQEKKSIIAKLVVHSPTSSAHCPRTTS
jgi:hypothetical protein